MKLDMKSRIERTIKNKNKWVFSSKLLIHLGYKLGHEGAEIIASMIRDSNRKVSSLTIESKLLIHLDDAIGVDELKDICYAISANRGVTELILISTFLIHFRQ